MFESTIRNLAGQIARLRRKAGGGFLTFRKQYFGHYHKVEDGLFQKEFSDLLARVAGRKISRLAVAAPRGFSKSTIANLQFVIYCICFHLEPFIVIISRTQDQAKNYLRDIKRELENNELLRTDFPDVCGHPEGGEERWAETEIITRNGVKVVALGTEQQLRGRRHGEHRPSLIILDDIETNEAARNPESARGLEDFLNRTVLKAGDRRTAIIFIGTMHHPNSLLVKFTDPTQVPGWTSRRYKAVISFAQREDLWERWVNILLNLETFQGESGPVGAKKFYRAYKVEMDAGVDVLWPQHMSYYDLMLIRAQEGDASFNSEFQNDPSDLRNCLFDINTVRYWDDEYGTEEELFRRRGEHFLLFGACDPSLGRPNRKGDFSAIVTVAVDDETQIVRVLDVDVSRRKPDRIIAAILEHARMRDYVRFGFEVNAFQSIMYEEIEKQADEERVCLLLKKIENTSNKEMRIESLQPMIASGRLQISRKHRALIEELKYYPSGGHDDALDALEMAVKLGLKGTAFMSCLYR